MEKMKDEGKYEPRLFEENIYKNWEDKKYFKSVIDKTKTPYTIIMPPPNVTSRLHMGHAFQQTIQDVIIRRKRMQGFNALWLPGSDHAAIATEAKVVAKLAREGITKEMLGRDKFQECINDWYKEYKGAIIDQFKMMGYSCDWDRLAFTMDEQNCKAVREVFVRLYKKGYIYRGNRIVNWCPTCKTSISDAEVDYQENHTYLWHIKYFIEGTNDYVEVATTRPETLFGDTAIAINPKDKRYKKILGKNVILPIVNRIIPIIADDYVDMKFGTGAVKITPAHDINDFEVGKRHNLEVIKVMNDNGTLNSYAGKFEGRDRLEAREDIVKELKTLGNLASIEEYNNNTAHCDRCHGLIETTTSMQWWVNMSKLAEPAIKAVEEDKVHFVEERYKRSYLHWMKNINDWCISRQLWSGHKIPIFVCKDCGEVIVESVDPTVCPKCGSHNLVQEKDTLDTWFSSALWSFSTLGWPDKTADLDYYYPTNVLVTDRGIINLWVARMIFSSLEFTGKVPFENVLINGTVNDELGRKMSKSLGNGVDPVVMINKYGVDTLRYSILNGVAVDADSRFSEKKVELSSAFMNKIWNTAKFVSIHSENEKVLPLENVKLSARDKWILHRLNDTVKLVNSNFEKFDLGIALSNTTSFILNDFCDWYIEMVKPILYAGGEAKTRTVAVLNFVLDAIVKLLHPFAPMISEYIYQRMDFTNKCETIMYAPFPEYSKKLNFKKDYQQIQKVTNLIRGTRNLKKDNNIPDNKLIDVAIFSTEMNLIKENLDSIKKMAGIANVSLLDKKEKTENSYSFISDTTELYMVVSNFDKAKEKEKLEKELSSAKFEVERSEKLLSNVGFTSKAPEALLEKEKSKLTANKELVKNIESKIAKI